MAKVPKKKSKSVKKAERQAKKRTERNKKRKAEIKKVLKEFKKSLQEKEIKVAQEKLRQLYKLLDKAKKTNLFKAGKVDRLKSKIAKAFNQIQQPITSNQ